MEEEVGFQELLLLVVLVVAAVPGRPQAVMFQRLQVQVMMAAILLQKVTMVRREVQEIQVTLVEVVGEQPQLRRLIVIQQVGPAV